MKKGRVPLALCLIGLFLLSIGCKTQEKAEKKSPLRKKSASYLFNKLHENELDFEWLSLRAATKAEIGDKKIDITLKIRIRKDSVIWISISPALGIEIARVIITKDSLRFLNRLERSYFSGSINYLDNLAPVSISYTMLQGLITGNNIIIQDKVVAEKLDKYYKVKIDRGNYLLSDLSIKKYNKTVKGKKTFESANRIWLRPKTFKIAKSEITNFKNQKKIIASYDEFEVVGEQIIAHLVEVVMQADQLLAVKLRYSKMTLNKPLKMPFRIPNKYKEIK